MAPEGKDVAALFGTPGLEQIFQIGDGPIRGALNFFNVTWLVVSGDTLYYTNDLSTTPLSLGTIAGDGRVSMCANLEDKVFITTPGALPGITGGYAYIYNFVTSTLTDVTADLPPIGGTCDFIDSYFVFEEAATASFYIYDGVTFDVLDVATAEGMPDHTVAVLADPAGLWIFCQLHTEVWQDIGATDFPFQRLPGGLIPQGCAAKFTPKRLDNSIFWLGRNEDGQGMVWRINGYSPVRVSTYAVEFAIQGYGDISDAFAQTYQQEGHSFYALTFPTAGKTWVLDVSNGLWHERSSVDPDTGRESRWRPNTLTHFQGEIVAGDYRTGKVFTLSLDRYTDGSYGPVIAIEPPMSSTSTTANEQLAAAVVASSGTGYQRLDVLTLSGGTYSRPAKVMVVNNAAGGAATTVAVVDAGDYTELPDNPVTANGGPGTVTLTAYWTSDDQIVIDPKSGAGYADAPTLAFDTTYGSGATATASVQLVAALKSIFGSGYVVGDVLTLSGGTSTTAAQVKVEAVNGGGVPQAYSIVEPGAYSVIPVGFVTLTGGSGSSASCTAFWGLGESTLTDGGTEYSQAPAMTVSQTGTGVGASPYAVVDATTNWIKSLRSWRAIPQGQNNLKRTFQHALQLDCESGVGLDSTGLGTDPLVSLRWSDDGGHTWSNKHYRKLGKIGKTGTRVIWRRLGSTEKLRDRVYEITVTDPVKRAFTAAELDLSAGAS